MLQVNTKLFIEELNGSKYYSHYNLEKTLDVLGLDTDITKRTVVEVDKGKEVSVIIPITNNIEPSVYSSLISSKNTTNHPAVDRMRATSESNVENPWLNMGVYLAQKIKEKMFE
eukprot:CAMPEP_0171013414 /NCGR_PEP_ID=MMETSP0736-20130129/24332_1 /TAXON_ID=186038 /ORGANISM="Fragilariopsis kerguelensis, Strain L26-C5" /LENGTH=113 /DNA_ID=CAMNT_0011447073 /DNA_START=767 /DNA_END=1108 /DNA_ORIENTATION=-